MIMLRVCMSLAALLSTVGAVTLTVGDRVYERTMLLNQHAISSHVVVDHLGTVLYRNANDKLLSVKPGDTPVLVSGLPNNIWDVVMSPSGEVWIATEEGIYNYNSWANKGVYAMAKGVSIAKLSAAADGSIYGTGDNNYLFYIIQNGILTTVPEVGKASRIAVSSQGDLYYTVTGNTPVYRRKGGPTGPTVALTGIPSTWSHVIEVDRRNDFIYIGTDSGMFFVRPGQTVATKVEGFGPVKGLGFDALGNMYVGTDREMFKLSPLN